MAEVPVAFCMYKFTFTFNHHLGTSFMYQSSFQVAGKNKNKVKGLNTSQFQNLLQDNSNQDNMILG